MLATAGYYGMYISTNFTAMRTSMVNSPQVNQLHAGSVPTALGDVIIDPDSDTLRNPRPAFATQRIVLTLPAINKTYFFGLLAYNRAGFIGKESNILPVMMFAAPHSNLPPTQGPTGPGSSDDSLSGGEVAGIVIAIILFVLLAALAFFCCFQYDSTDGQRRLINEEDGKGTSGSISDIAQSNKDEAISMAVVGKEASAVSINTDSNTVQTELETKKEMEKETKKEMEKEGSENDPAVDNVDGDSDGSK